MGKYKLRQSPEDFQVEEIFEPDLGAEEYAIYELTKRGIDTSEAIRRMAEAIGVKPGSIGYCGLKDRHAVTLQYVSIPAEGFEEMPEEGGEEQASWKVVGTSDRPLKLGDHTGNRFSIIARKVDQKIIDRLEERVELIKKIPLPNYFDSQRFVSARATGKLAAMEIIKGDAEGAVWLIIAAPDRKASNKIKVTKRILLEDWGKWKAVLRKLPKGSQRTTYRIVKHLSKNHDDYEGALAAVSYQETKFMVAAFQSFMFNQTLRRVLKKRTSKRKLTEVEYVMGSLSFYKHLDKALEFFDGGELADLSGESRDVMPDGDDEWAQAYQDVFNGLGLTDIGMEKLDKVWPDTLRNNKRELFFKPTDLTVEVDGDSVKMEFDLGPGSYATLLIKYLLD